MPFSKSEINENYFAHFVNIMLTITIYIWLQDQDEHLKFYLRQGCNHFEFFYGFCN